VRPEDRAFAAREPALRGMSLLLDDDAVAAALRERLPDAGVRAARGTYIRYKPGTNCLVAFELDTASGPRLAYGRTEHEDDGAKLRKAHEKARSGAVLVEDPPVALLLFPSDRRLRSLIAVMTDSATVLAYKPERRLVARRGREVIKAYRADGFAAARGAAAALPAGLPVQRCIAARKRHAMLVFDWVDGWPLDSVLQPPPHSSRERPPETALPPPLDSARKLPDGAGAALEALRALHSAVPAGPLPCRTRAVEAAALVAAADATGVAGPRVEWAARRLAERLAAALPADPAPKSLLHGDFSADQVVIGAGGAVMLDMDAACLGDPRWDLGSALGDLELRVLEGRLAPAAAAATAAVLVGDDAHAVHPFAAAGLLRRAAEPFRRRRQGWDALVEAAVERAAELAALQPPATRPVNSTARAPADSPTRDAKLAPPPRIPATSNTLPPNTRLASRRKPQARDGAIASLRRISPPPGASSPGALSLRRAWPRPDGRLLLEYRDERGAIVAAQAGLDGEAIAAERCRAERVGAPPPLVANHRVLLHARGADGRLPALHRLLEGSDVRLVAHRATRRAVVALYGSAGVEAVRANRTGTDADAAPTAAYIKAVRPSRAAAVAGAARAAAQLVAGVCSVPAVLAVDRRSGTVTYATMPGRRLTDLLATRAGADAIEALGSALRTLHAAARPPNVDLHDAAREARLVIEAAAALTPYAPELSERTAGAGRAAARRLRSLPPVAPVPVHRDLHDKQVLVGASGIGLLDFDTLALGDPALDLGNMLAHLELRALQGRCSPADAERLTAALLDGYRAGADIRERIAVYAHATRVRLACLYAFRPGWPTVPVALLADRPCP